MQNKGFVVTFAVVLALVCLYYLSFTFVSQSYKNDAKDFAIAYAKKNANGDKTEEERLYNQMYYHYIDSLSTDKVYLTFGKSSENPNEPMVGYTLRECMEKEIGLGLDLQGGMSVVVEVNAEQVLRSLGDESNESFLEALKVASANNKAGTSSQGYVEQFVKEFKAKNGNNKLAPIFASKLKSYDINYDTPDNKVVDVLNQELESIADNTFNVLRNRIDRFGVVAPNIQKLDNRAEQIMVELPGVKEPERVRKLLQSSANLEFWKTYSLNDAGIYDELNKINELSQNALNKANVGDSLSVDMNDLAKELGFTKPFASYVDMNRQTKGMTYDAVGIVNKRDTVAVNKILNLYAKAKERNRGEYLKDLKFAWSVNTVDPKETLVVLHMLKGSNKDQGAVLNGDVVESANAAIAPGSIFWSVDMQMNSEGAKKWSRITEDAKGSALAIVLDGYVYSAPMVNAKIDGGRSSITGDFTAQQANDLVNVLKSGKMKYGVSIVKEDVIGSSLGDEAIKAGVYSFILAIILLMIYICTAYGLIPGLVANAALLINLFFTVGILCGIGTHWTLAGITGLVLSLAMAVDANVLIYERTREELRAGKNVKQSLADGYKHAFSAIFDANVTSILTAIILIIFGTGPIQGFATTLIVGIVVSFITAVYLTRVFYEYMLEKGKLHNLTFTTPVTRNLFIDNNYNFLSKTNIFFALSAIVAIAGCISLAINKLDFGIEFTGGRNYTVRFDKNVSTDAVRNELNKEFAGSNILVLTSGSGAATSGSSQMRISTNFEYANPNKDSIDAVIDAKMTKALAPNFSDGKTSFNDYVLYSQQVGPSMAKDLQTSATIAVVLAIIVMALYILVRFRDVAFSVGTFVAVIHDALMVIFAYSLLYKIMPFSMEIDQAFIAAILTVVGYSINDKVVIFDRIRETRNLFPSRDITLVINDALNSTLGRTVNTSLSTMIVIFCIFVLGGDSIRSFTFAIFIGVFIGTYSSLFIATPIAWKMLRSKQQSKKK